MPRPCPQALATYRVPARRFRTRAELLELVEQARQLLGGSLTSISLASLGQSVGLAPFHLQRVFLEVYGASPSKYQRRIRLEHAVRELQAGVPQAVVAMQLGYSDSSAFSKAFAREFGLPPGAFRKNGQSSLDAARLD